MTLSIAIDRDRRQSYTVKYRWRSLSVVDGICIHANARDGLKALLDYSSILTDAIDRRRQCRR